MLVGPISDHLPTNCFSEQTLWADVLSPGVPAKTEQILLPFKAEEGTLFSFSPAVRARLPISDKSPL